MTNIFKAILCFCLFHFAQPAFFACGCIGTFEGFRPCQAFWGADVVFTGRVSEITRPLPVDPSNPDIVSDNGRLVRFEINDTFRGVAAGGRVELVLPGSSCDYGFEAGQSYFVYAGRNPQNGRISTSNCGRTRPLAEAEDDLAYARDLRAGKRGPSVFGVVLRHVRASAKDYARTEGIKVRIKKDDRTYEAVTNDQGRFEFFDLPDGDYRVWADIPNGLRPAFEDPAEFYEKGVTVSAPACAAVSFVTTSLGSLTGIVLEAGGRPAAEMKVGLVPVNPQSGEVIDTEQQIETYTDAAGRYVFANLAEGSYAVAVNPLSQPGTYDPPYPRTFAPGVKSVSEAKVLSLTDGQFLSAPDLRLPPRLKERLIEGVVRWPDGRPVEGAVLTQVYTERSWLEVRGHTDAAGRFSLKGYEGYSYVLHAEKDMGGGRGPAGAQKQQWFHAEPNEVIVNGEIKPIVLTMTRQGRAEFKFPSEQKKKN